MFCPNCGTMLEENVSECSVCGAAITAASKAQTDFPDPTVLPTPEQGRIDPEMYKPAPEPEQEIDLDSVVENISEPEPIPDSSKQGFTDQDMAWFTDHQPQNQPQQPQQPQQYQPQSTFPQQPYQQQIPPAMPAGNPQYFSGTPISVAPIPDKSNILLGLIGAVAFSLIGCVIWVIIGSLGYISYLGALALSFLTVTGYKLLGKRFDAPGIIICIIVIALAVLASNVFINAIAIATDEELMEFMSALGYKSFSDIFLHFFDMMKDVDLILETYAPGEGTMTGEFTSDLVISYIFSAIAFAVVAVSQYRASKHS